MADNQATRLKRSRKSISVLLINPKGLSAPGEEKKRGGESSRATATTLLVWGVNGYSPEFPGVPSDRQSRHHVKRRVPPPHPTKSIGQLSYLSQAPTGPTSGATVHLRGW